MEPAFSRLCEHFNVYGIESRVHLKTSTKSCFVSTPNLKLVIWTPTTMNFCYMESSRQLMSYERFLNLSLLTLLAVLEAGLVGIGLTYTLTLIERVQWCVRNNSDVETFVRTHRMFCICYCSGICVAVIIMCTSMLEYRTIPGHTISSFR